MVGRYVKHFFRFRCKFYKYICRITHNNRTQSKRIGEQFKVGSCDIAIYFGIFCPFARTFFVGNKQMGSTAKKQIIFSDCFLRFFHLAVIEVAKT